MEVKNKELEKETKMEREEIIDHLMENTYFMNYHMVENGERTQEEHDDLMDDQRVEYEKMSDMQLQNIMVMNSI